MKKRPSLKGKGAEIFLSGEPAAGRATRPTAAGHETKREAGEEKEKEKATFYFPPKLLSDLDEAWMKLRRENRRIKKSDLVRAALVEALADFKRRGRESLLAAAFQKRA
ncbi:MAG TPA: hypothetical protein PKN80_01185 [bacterium]|uniref:Uncharacterized protein n=1 Tax=candidate division TA06 bacterium ADurb.Bin417 TaxID=1852828 RepID=A0A1V5MGS9_UNCT6|nr:MAG: hypothetical protein BWY73_00847 [candidate division TA06 bacterium ADurb.Bin417]HNQ34661.1 hypothetical protein [bacterium]HNS49010.1 hypothetical protein [bacterium]